MTPEQMKELAERTVLAARSHGAETAEASVYDSREIEVGARKGSVENITHSASSSIAVTVSVDKRKASVTSSELCEESILNLVLEAIELARLMNRDEFFDLPDAEELGSADGELDIFDSQLADMETERMIESALLLEKTACSLDGRIISDGATVSYGVYHLAFANSLGFCNAYSKTNASIGISCAAEEESRRGENLGKKQSSYWFSNATSSRDLEPLESVARKAVQRTLRKLGAVKPKTREAPVVFDPVTARRFVSHLSTAVDGGKIYRKSSFLVDMKGKKIGSPLLSVHDDPLLTGKLGTHPFDGEGVRARRNTVIDKGILRSYLMDSYQARKLGGKTTGNSGGPTNFYMMPGSCKPASLIEGVDEGLYLTTLIGPGANTATGDFSQGAQGIWIEKGELAHPVDEFTIAGTFQRMLNGITMVADDIEWNSNIAAPSFMIDGMIISGT
jgi:PmbA protein